MENKSEETVRSKIVRAHLLVSGRVQGVGFRAFVQLQATNLGLDGWVRNRPNGTVESEVEGERAAIDTFLERVREGPTLSRVEMVQVDWAEANRQTKGFLVLK
ncbi:MAG: acylphosphatase [Nitrospirales bacterium]